MNLPLLLITLAWLWSFPANSQVKFQKVFGGAGTLEDFVSVKQSMDGGFLFVGQTNGSGAGERDATLLKTDFEGNREWSKTYGGAAHDQALGVMQLTDGSLVIFGQTASYSQGMQDIYLLKTDVNGNLIWSKTYGGPFQDRCWSMIHASDGSFVIAGETVSYGVGGGKSDVYLLKTDSNGDLLWSKTFGGTESDNAKSIIESADGGYVLCGTSVSYGAGNGDVYLLKTDIDGNLLWSKTFGGVDADHGQSIIICNDSGYLISGSTYSYGAGNWDIYLIKIDTDATIEWTKTYGGTGHDVGWKVIQDMDGGYVIAGSTSSYGGGNDDGYLLKVDNMGNVEWAKAYGDYGGWIDVFNGVTQSDDGGYLAVGRTYSWDTNPLNTAQESYVVKTDNSGNSGCHENAFVPDVSSGVIVGSGVTLGTGAVQGSGCIEAVWLPDTLLLCPDCTPITAVASQQNISCFNECSGSITITPMAGRAPFTYQWNPPVSLMNDSTAIDLCPGNYSVVMTGIDGCEEYLNFTITEPLSLNLTASSTDATCGLLDGSGSVSVTGGTPGYTYEWNDGFSQTTATATGLPSGNYSVTVTDFNGCSSQVSINIGDVPSLILTTNVNTPILCNGQSIAQVTSTAVGGTPGYTYLWNDLNSQTNATATGLSAGNYTVTVTDQAGCTESELIIVTEPTPLTSDLSTISLLCNGDFNGSATSSPAGGTAGYIYQWDASAGNQTTSTATDLSQGSYNLIITDANGCQTTETAMITEPLAISLNTSSVDATCGQADGTATVVSTGGTPGYSYQWDVAAQNQVTPIATGLGQGSYTITVTDGNGCIKQTTVDVVDFGGPVAVVNVISNVSCIGLSDGSAIVNVVGGTGALSYNWSPIGGNSQGASNLAAGIYTVTITDTNQCQVTELVTITEPEAIVLNVTQQNANCGQSDGNTTVTANGGTGVGTYTYLWDVGAQNQITQTATGLSQGSYTVIVTDGNGCNEKVEVIIADLAGPTVAVNVTSGILCFGDSNAAVTANNIGGSAPFTYIWNTTPAQNSQIATDLSSGTYTVTLTDINGCVATQNIPITEPSLLEASMIPQDATCDENNGSLSAIAAGGTSDYNYRWDYNNLTTPVISNLPAGTYTVIIKDANDCEAKQSANVIMSSVIPLANAQPLLSTIQQGESVDLMASGGTSYIWSPSAGLDDPNSQSPVASPEFTTMYIVEVADNGCKNTDTVTIIVEKEKFTIFIPNAFTPNQDKANELFELKGASITEYHLQILDRWGEIIFESHEINTSWDGSVNGKHAAQQDVYVYHLTLKDLLGSTYKYIGRLTLIE